MIDESNLRTVLRQRAEHYDVRYELPTSTIIRTRLRLVAKTVLAAAVVVGVAWTATALDFDSISGATGTQDDPASSSDDGDVESSGYSFSNISVVEAAQVPGNEGPKDLVLVRFDYAWRTSIFPGFRECMFAVYDAGGQEIGHDRLLVRFTEPEGSSLRKIYVDGVPASAQIECGPRLPDPESRYEITDVRIDATSPWEIVLIFDSVWKGEESVSEARCIHSVFDVKGRTVVVDEFTFMTEAEKRNDISLSLEAPSGAGEKANRAEVICY